MMNYPMQQRGIFTKLNERKRMKKIIVALSMFLFLGLEVKAQQPASIAYAGANARIKAETLGFDGVGIGPSIGVGVRLPRKLYLTEDLDVTFENKFGLKEGRTVGSTTGLQYHFNNLLFARGGLLIKNHSNEAFSRTVTRVELGGGAQVLNSASLLPMIEVSAFAELPLKNVNEVKVFKVRARGFYEFPHSAFGVMGKVEGAREFFDGGWRGHGFVVEGGVFVNLSALAGY